MQSLYILVCVLGFAAPDDGSLLVIEGGSALVQEHTQSPYSHVAMIFKHGGESWVYEACRPKIRKVRLSEYITEVEAENLRRKGQMKVWIMRPKQLSKRQIQKMWEYHEDQLGRKYSIKSYLTGSSQRTIHCGELTARALNAADIKLKSSPPRVTPAEVVESVKPYYDELELLLACKRPEGSYNKLMREDLHEDLAMVWTELVELISVEEYTDEELSKPVPANKKQIVDLCDRLGEILTKSHPDYRPPTSPAVAAMNPWYMSIEAALQLKEMAARPNTTIREYVPIPEISPEEFLQLRAEKGM